MEQLASVDREHNATKEQKEQQVQQLQHELKRAQHKQKRQEQENTKLLELSNSLRSQLNHMMMASGDTTLLGASDEHEYQQQKQIRQQQHINRSAGQEDPHHGGEQPGTAVRALVHNRHDLSRHASRASEQETTSQRQSRRAKLREHSAPRRATVRNYNIADDSDTRAKLTIAPPSS